MWLGQRQGFVSLYKISEKQQLALQLNQQSAALPLFQIVVTYEISLQKLVRMDGMRRSGTVKFFLQSKGFGFITPDDGATDVFVHISAVEQSEIPPLDQGIKLTFETEPDKKGKGDKAVNLVVVTE